MNEPLTLHWEASGHSHSAMLMPDLFGGWVLVTTSGERERRGGRMHRKVLASYEEGMQALHELRHRRRREGYALSAASFTPFDGLDARDPSLRAAETDALLRLFSDWALTSTEQADLLGLGAKELGRLQDGQALGEAPELQARAHHLLAINKALRLRFGDDAELKRTWLRGVCSALQDRSPLTVMRESLAALAQLRLRISEQADEARGCDRA